MASAVASSPIERLIARRSAERLSQARTAAKRVLAHGGMSWAETERIAARAGRGFPLELVFAETLSPGRLARLRAGSLDARDL